MKRDISGKVFAIQTKWLRITQNPDVPNYPRSGNFVILVEHNLVPNGRYLVKMVEEFEPAFTKDEDGRDIRICLTNGIENWEDLNGVNVRQAMLSQAQETLSGITEEK